MRHDSRSKAESGLALGNVVFETNSLVGKWLRHVLGVCLWRRVIASCMVFNGTMGMLVAFFYCFEG